MPDFKTLLAGAKLPERSVPVCLRGDLVATFEELERQLVEAQRVTSTSIEDAGAAGIAERMEAVRAEMREHTYPFRLRALPKPEYRDLKAKHPPRKDDDGAVRSEDVFLDANLDELGEPLLRACIVEPILDDADWADLVGKLTDRQYSDLVGTAIYVNKGSVDVPFSHAASNLLRSSEPE
jgi:hypothetical protein